MKLLKKITLLLLTGAMIFALAACGNNNQTPNNSSNGTVSADRIIVLAQRDDVLSLDPQGHNSLCSGNVTRMIYDSLVRFDENNEVVPMLAESWGYLDKNTFQIKLKPDVPFHNGDIMTAEDVQFTLERMLESSFSSHLLNMVTDIEVVDNLTLKLLVADDSAALVSSLAHQCAGIVPKAYTEQLESEGKTLSDAPCGTGPYRFDYWRVGDDCQVVRFDDYYDKDHAAKNGGLRFRYIAEDNSRVIALETGAIDVLLNVPNASVASLENNSKVKVLKYESCDLYYMAPNCSAAPFDNELLRQAVAYCIDRDAMIQVQCSGNATATYAPIGIAAIGSSEPAVKYTYDLEKAKEKLVEAGYPDGFEFTLSVSGDGFSKSAQVLKASCAEVGIIVNIDVMDYSPLASRCGAAEHQVGMDNWCANNEPDNTYRPWFSRSLIGTGGYNWSCYTGDEIETLVNEAVSLTDMQERLKCYAEINDFVSEHAIVWPMFTLEGIVTVGANVDGINLYSTGMHQFQNITISE